MIQTATIDFLKALEINNNKPWFDENKKLYDAAKENIQDLTGKLIPVIAAFDDGIGSLQIKDCTFRINRDIRFSKNKTPYKTNMAASFSRGGKKANIAGYYFHCEPGKSFAGGGFYGPMPLELGKIRQEIDYNFDEWEKMICSKEFKKYFPAGIDGIESLIRPPKGYVEDNPAITYLKMKHYIVSKPFTDEELHKKKLVNDIAKVFAALKPLVDFLNRAIG